MRVQWLRILNLNHIDLLIHAKIIWHHDYDRGICFSCPTIDLLAHAPVRKIARKNRELFETRVQGQASVRECVHSSIAFLLFVLGLLMLIYILIVFRFFSKLTHLQFRTSMQSKITSIELYSSHVIGIFGSTTILRKMPGRHALRRVEEVCK